MVLESVIKLYNLYRPIYMCSFLQAQKHLHSKAKNTSE